VVRGQRPPGKLAAFQLGDARRLLGHLRLQLGNAIAAPRCLLLGLVPEEALLGSGCRLLLVGDDPRVASRRWKIASARR
jgi:hypothetical protein